MIYIAIGFTEHRIGVHRLSYMVHYGSIPENKMILHYCHNKGCINPNHLHVGLYSDNGNDERYKHDRLILRPRDIKLAKCMKESDFTNREIAATLSVSLSVARSASLGIGAYRPLPERSFEKGHQMSQITR